MIPRDPVILLSFLNARLRDLYPSLDELCYEMEVDKTEITEKLHAIGYDYSEELNQFK